MVNVHSIILTSFLSIAVGGILGSFFNMLIYRLPKQKSILFPRSFCPNCKHNLSWKNLIPIVSFCFQKGSCSFCGSLISKRYIVVECLQVFLTFWYLFPNSFVYLNHQFFVFCSICIILFFTDLEHFMLPFYVNLSLIPLGLFFAIKHSTVSSVLISTLILIGVLFLFRALFNYLYKRDTFGIGDIILLGGFCINWGWILSVMSFYFAAILGGLYSIYLLVTKRKKRLDYIPFGPFLILGFYASYFFHEYVISMLF